MSALIDYLIESIDLSCCFDSSRVSLEPKLTDLLDTNSSTFVSRMRFLALGILALASFAMGLSYRGPALQKDSRSDFDDLSKRRYRFRLPSIETDSDEIEDPEEDYSVFNAWNSFFKSFQNGKRLSKRGWGPNIPPGSFGRDRKTGKDLTKENNQIATERFLKYVRLY